MERQIMICRGSSVFTDKCSRQEHIEYRNPFDMQEQAPGHLICKCKPGNTVLPPKQLQYPRIPQFLKSPVRDTELGRVHQVLFLVRGIFPEHVDQALNHIPPVCGPFRIEHAKGTDYSDHRLSQVLPYQRAPGFRFFPGHGTIPKIGKFRLRDLRKCQLLQVISVLERQKHAFTDALVENSHSPRFVRTEHRSEGHRLNLIRIADIDDRHLRFIPLEELLEAVFNIPGQIRLQLYGFCHDG